MNRNLDQWLAVLERRHGRNVDLGLERCGEVYASLGAPRPGAHVTSVAGTNGKGSVVAMQASILRELGHSVAAYTSPHIRIFNERLRIDDEEVGDEVLLEAFEAVEAARGNVSLTFFEFTTLACLHIMHRARPDHAILEVGLGGRLDAVNLVDADLAVITVLGIDHQEYLGTNREVIGMEKAGIFRPRQTVVIGDPHPPAGVLERADELECKTFAAGRDFWLEGDGGKDRVFRMGQHSVVVPPPSLAGAHQWQNSAVAIAAATLTCPWIVRNPQAVQSGIRHARVAGRLQRAKADPRVVLDVGHNALAASAVAAYLDEQGGANGLCVLGMLRDKDAEGVAEALSKVIDRWYCAGLGGERGQDAATLARRVGGALPQARVREFDSVPAALDQARSDADDNTAILVFGSFQTVARAMDALELE